MTLIYGETTYYERPNFAAQNRINTTPQKDPVAAALWGIIPTGGQIYNGEWWPKGFLILAGLSYLQVESFFASFRIGGFMGGSNSEPVDEGKVRVLDFLSYGLYIYSIVDAYQSAERINQQIGQKEGLNISWYEGNPVLQVSHNF